MLQYIVTPDLYICIAFPVMKLYKLTVCEPIATSVRSTAYNVPFSACLLNEMPPRYGWLSCMSYAEGTNL